MRKSGRLTSIHDDDNHTKATDTAEKINLNKNSESDPSKVKKFTPMIPTVRRKKVVEDEVAVGDFVTNTNSMNRSQAAYQRKPLNSKGGGVSYYSSNPSVVSGPLSLGPAAMARSNRSTSSGSASSSGSSLSARTSRLGIFSSLSNSNSDVSKPFGDYVAIEEEFSNNKSVVIAANEEIDHHLLLKPVVLSETKVETSPSSNFTNFDFEPEKLFLFQMPPVLPSLTNFPSISSTDEAEKWPIGAQGRYGRFRRYKSGKLVLILENGVEFSVNPSVELEVQNTNVLAIDPEFAQSFNLGPVAQKFVCIPEFEKFQKLHI